MSRVRVAVVDSGIHPTHPHIQGVSGGVAFSPSGVPSDDYVDRLGHGTAVAAAIRDLSPTVSLLAVKVFDTSLAASVDALCAGIEWANREGASLINLSLGVADIAHAPAMRSVVGAAAHGGSIVVAAGEHNGVRWLPGTLPGVLRVELDWRYPRGQFGFASVDGIVTCRTCGYPRPIPGVDPERNLKGLSFAVANMTGLAAQILADKGPDEDLRTLPALAAQLEARSTAL